MTAPIPRLVSVTGPLFAIASAKLAFVAQPTNTTSNTAFSPNIQVAIQDSTGTTLTGSSATVTLTIGTNPSGGTLTCTGGNSVATVSGVATFTGCSINNPGAGYTLVATATVVALDGLHHIKSSGVGGFYRIRLRLQ